MVGMPVRTASEWPRKDSDFVERSRRVLARDPVPGFGFQRPSVAARA
jgi:hypothetical protein